jgi:competence protein ComEC
MLLIRPLLLLALLVPALFGAKTLDIYFIDVEGGQATLIVSPSGESMLVDAGWPGYNNRDADRILAAAKAAGVNRIDYLVVTHYHTDHVGGVPQLVQKLPVRTFVDHGENTETGKQADELASSYKAVRDKAKHLIVKAGDSIPLKGVTVDVLTARGDMIANARPGAAEANPGCSAAQRRDEDKTENARSVGTLVTFGKFRLLNLGDLTWNKELDLVCPNNRIGTVDVYLTTHHGMNMSGPDAIVHAVRPRVAIMNNGPRKGGTPEAWQTIRKSPGLEDIWQLHFAVKGGKETNAPDMYIANLEENCVGKWIKLSANQDGSFTVTNTRNGYSKTYKK